MVRTATGTLCVLRLTLAQRSRMGPGRLVQCPDEQRLPAVWARGPAAG